MCKATVENSENSETFAAGLNGGILYLMSIPYILFGVIAFMWYRSSRKNKDKKEKIEKRLKNTLSSN
jgi:preprotein translocase subunit YajC